MSRLIASSIFRNDNIGPLMPALEISPPPGEPPAWLEECESSEEIIIVDPDYIIRERPPIKLVRDFFRDYLGHIRSEEEILFDPPQ